MRRLQTYWLWTIGAAVFGTACASGGAPQRDGPAPLARVPGDTARDNANDGAAALEQLGAALARAERDSAADQTALDSLHDRSAAAPARRRTGTAIEGREVEEEAERLFGADADADATFDIDVTSFGANQRVLQYLEFFQIDARDRFEIWLARLGRYEGMIRARLRAKGLPEDLVYLTLIESGLSNTAVSRARAVGMWQFMTATGRGYGLQIDPWVDERRDPFKATEAAVNHLSDLVRRWGSVYLAAAAYNAGAGRVERGIRRLPGEPDSVGDHTFFQIADRHYLRRETRDYVPKLIAAALVAKQPERYGFRDIERLTPLVFDEVTVADATGLDVLARLADTSVASLLELNPQFVRGITPPGREVVVRVPRGTGASVAEGYAEMPINDRVTFVDHYVTGGQTLSGIAQRYRVTVAMLQSANPGLRARALRIGQRVIVPMSGRIVPRSAWSTPPQPPVRSISRASGGGGGAQSGRVTRHRVTRGETASAIARRHRVSLTALLNANEMTMETIIRPGDVLKIPSR